MTSIREVASRVMMMLARGVVRSVDDTGGRQKVQVELFKGELRDGVEHMQNYGFTSHPTGGDAAVASLGGNREQCIVLIVDDRRYRLKLKPGEVAMYDDHGQSVQILRDMILVTATQHTEVQSPTIKLVGAVEIVGNTSITGTLTNNGKAVGSTHTHTNGGSGVPT